MRIGIDASWACGQRTGTGHFTLTLVRSLLETAPEHDYLLYLRPCCAAANPLYRPASQRAAVRIVGGRRTVWRSLAGLSPTLRRDAVEVFLSPGYFVPLSAPCPTVVVFHDMAVYRNRREWWRKGRYVDLLVLRAVIPLSVRRATRIVAVSEETRRDLVSLFPRARDKAVVIHNGVDAKRLQDVPAAAPPAAVPYFLYVGVISPTKNLARLVRAFRAFAETDPTGTQLVLAGRDCAGYWSRVLHPLIRSLGIESRVRWQGFVDDAALARLYRQATALVLPSLIEGFGYPIVEAMQAGTAVIASNRSGCAEVAGEAALLVDPFSVEAIRGALTAVRRDATLRERLVGLGAVRCKQFSCAAMAQAYVRVLLAAARHTPEDFRT